MNKIDCRPSMGPGLNLREDGNESIGPSVKVAFFIIKFCFAALVVFRQSDEIEVR